jgi:uncharacterized protein YbjT (DUF2867 family)
VQRVLVTGATGTIGRQVVQQLVSHGVAVRALSRNPEVAALPSEVEVVRGDLTVPAELDGALQDVEAVFLVWTAPADTAAEAIRSIASHTGRVVYLTAPHRTPHPFFQQPNPAAALHAANEALIESSGLRWTFVRPGMFAANTLWWWAPQIRAGDVVRWPYADAATAPIDERDVAAVAVRSLLDARHEGGDYVITGPESLTQGQQVAAIGEAIGRSLRFEELSPEEARGGLKGPPAAVNMLLNAWAAAVGIPAFVTSTVAQITGRPARPFRTWAADHAAAFRTG